MKQGKLLLITVLLLLSAAVSLVHCGGGGGGGGGGTQPPPASSNANLASLTASNGLMNPSFDPATTAYTSMFIGQSSITVTPTAADAGSTIKVNGSVVASGSSISGHFTESRSKHCDRCRDCGGRGNDEDLYDHREHAVAGSIRQGIQY